MESLFKTLFGIHNLELERICGLTIHEITCANEPDCPVVLEQAQMATRGNDWLWQQPNHMRLAEIGRQFIKVHAEMIRALMEEKRKQEAQAGASVKPRAKIDKCTWPDCGCLRERKSPRCPEASVSIFPAKNQEPL